jgi:hypothetical protein
VGGGGRDGEGEGGMGRGQLEGTLHIVDPQLELLPLFQI